jgi:hypothetical protein
MHCHLVISSNEVESQRNKRFDKKQFGNIKEKLREYAYNKYPKLERIEKKKRKTRAKTKTIDNELQYKRRTGKQSDKEIMKERLQAIFLNSQDQQSLINNLQTENIKIYQRGNTFGFLDTSTDKKYRLKTLELEDEFHKLNDRLTKQATNTKQGEETMNAHYQDTSEFRQAEYVGQHIGQIRDVLKEIIQDSKSYDEFFANIKNNNIEMYKVDDTFGFYNMKTGYKYRLKTLFLEDNFNDMISKFSSTEQITNEKKVGINKGKAKSTNTKTANADDISNQKKKMISKVSKIMKKSKTYENLRDNLRKEKYTIYFIDNTCGFIDLKTTLKCRLDTLGLQNEFVYFIDELDKHNILKASDIHKNKLKDIAKKIGMEVLRDVKYFVTGKKPREKNSIHTNNSNILRDEFINKMRDVANAIKQQYFYVHVQPSQTKAKQNRAKSQNFETKNEAYREELIQRAEKIAEAQRKKTKVKTKTR